MLSDFAAWLWQALKDFGVWVVRQLLDAAAWFIEQIPVPDWAHAENVLGGIPCEVTYFLEPLQLGEGAAIVGAALFLRFMIRRLPIVG